MYRTILAAAAVIALFTSANAQLGTTSQVGTSSFKDTTTLPLPPKDMTDSVATEMQKSANAKNFAKIYRYASATLPNCSAESAEAIYPNDSKKVQELVYGKSYDPRIRQMTLEQMAKDAKTRAATVVATGDETTNDRNAE